MALVSFAYIFFWLNKSCRHKHPQWDIEVQFYIKRAGSQRVELMTVVMAVLLILL